MFQSRLLYPLIRSCSNTVNFESPMSITDVSIAKEAITDNAGHAGTSTEDWIDSSYCNAYICQFNLIVLGYSLIHIQQHQEVIVLVIRQTR